MRKAQRVWTPLQRQLFVDRELMLKGFVPHIRLVISPEERLQRSIAENQGTLKVTKRS